MTVPGFAPSIQGPINQFQQGFPSLQTALNQAGFSGLSSCGILDFGCNANNVAQATVFVGGMIAWLNQMILRILVDLSAFIILIIGISTVFTSNVTSGIPLVPIIFIAFGVIFVAEIATRIRGQSP